MVSKASWAQQTHGTPGMIASKCPTTSGVGMWSVAYFSDMRERHEALKKRFPDREETRAKPYEGIANLRPETEALLEYYFAAQKAAE